MPNKKPILVLALLVTVLPLLAGMDYFIEVPGVRGEATQTGNPLYNEYKGWLKCLTLHYRLQGIPLPNRLETQVPNPLQGILIASEITHPYFSFSMPQDKSSEQLDKAFNTKQFFDQCKVAVCSGSGKTVITFILKEVTIANIAKRDNKIYLTLHFKRVIWNYIRQ